MNSVQSKICHCEERSDAAIRIPLCAMWNAEKRERIPTSAWRPPRNDRGEMNGVQLRICHCEERSDAAIRIPLCVMRNAEKKRTDSHVGAAPLLGMTGEK